MRIRENDDLRMFFFLAREISWFSAGGGTGARSVLGILFVIDDTVERRHESVRN